MTLPDAGLLDAEIGRIHDKPSILNNFPGYLPYGFYRQTSMLIFEMDGIPPRYCEPREEYNGKSRMEFYSDFNNAVFDQGIPLEEIEELQTELAKGFEAEKLAYDALIRLTLPVYRSLREQGYSMQVLQG